MMTAPPSRSVVWTFAGVQLVLRPGAFLLYGGLAAAIDLSFLPTVLPHETALHSHLTAVVIGLLMIAMTLLHEGGHALAYRVQGIWPVRITLRGSGGGCAAYVDHDTPGRALVRALAGPVMTTLGIVIAVLVWQNSTLPQTDKVVAETLTIFSVFDLVSNALPVHPLGDGTYALQALLWLLRGERPERLVLLYVWRPLVLAGAILLLAVGGTVVGVLQPGTILIQVVAVVTLLLCSIPPIALARRFVAVEGSTAISLGS